MTATVPPSVERGAHAALYTKEDGFGLWEPVKVLSLAWAADDVARAHAPVRVILAAALDAGEMHRVIVGHRIRKTEEVYDDTIVTCLCEAECSGYDGWRYHQATALRAAILGGEVGEADPGLLLILLGAGIAVLAGATALAIATGIFG